MQTQADSFELNSLKGLHTHSYSIYFELATQLQA